MAMISWSTNRCWRGKAPGKPFGLDGKGRPLEFRLLHVIEFADERRHQTRERVA